MKGKIPTYLLILFLVVIIFLQRECHRCPEAVTLTTINTIPGDSVPYLVEIDKPVPKFIDTGSWHYFDVDTMAILKDYFARVVYLDTLKDDSSAFIAVMDTVFQNRLQGRSLYFANRKPTSIIHNTTVLPEVDDRLKLYAGAMVAMAPRDRYDFGPAVILMTPRGNGYSYAFGVNEKSHTITLVWKVKLKRKRPP
ncbi:MAG: hypothetical protein FD166_2807 [Bacteroidetes bacterium]|nr:MAG: hypothetical protein FD166_2807 [Bacteroidota bacterium]